MTELLKQKDIEFAKNLYAKISKNKELFLELLDNILDLVTFIPVCMDEYGQSDFEHYNINEFILNINNILEEYGINIAIISYDDVENSALVNVEKEQKK